MGSQLGKAAFLLLLLSSPGMGETPAPVPFAPQIQQEQPQQVPQFETGKVDPGQAPKPPMKTRTESTAMAAAMEAQAAAMAQVSCFQMMQQAMKKDDKEMMMMAQMMCQQASQNLMAAAQNKRNSDKMKDAEPGKAASMELGKFKMPEAGKEEALQGGERGVASSESTTSGEVTVADPLEIPSFEKKRIEAPPQEVPETSPVPVEGSSMPGAIEVAKLGYDETGKSGSGPTPERTLPTGTSIATAKPGEAGNKTSPEGNSMGDAQPKGRGARGSSQDGEGTGSSGGSDEAKSDDGDSPLAAMMAMLNGGQGETLVTQPGEDLVNLTNGTDSGKPAPNIFEYATYRYKKTTFEEGKIKTKTTKAAKLVVPSVVASQAAATP